jgi:ketosteroid isomerase-like protein
VAIQALDEQWSATAARNDLEGTVSFYSDDAVLLPPKRAGRDRSEVDQGFLGEPARPNKAVSRTVSKAEIAKSGELGYLYGTYSLSIGGPKGGAPVRDTGKLFEI